MRWIILLLLSSCPLFSLFSAPAPDPQASSSEWVQFLHLAECELPCWINIVPGVTTIAEAQARIESVYADTLLYDVTRGQERISYLYYSITYRPTGHQVRTWISSDNGLLMTGESVIRRISWELGVISKDDIKRPTIAELRTFLGVPETVRLASGVESPVTVLIFKDGRVHTSVNDLVCDKILPNQEAPSITLYEEAPTYWAWLSDPYAWVGYDHCYNFERKLF